jgi:hypothetical protein
MAPFGIRPSPVGGVLPSVLRRIDPDQQLRAYGIWTFWDDEVGAVIAQRAQPAGFRDGVLFVTVASHSWMQELRFLKEGIRERLNGRLGAELVRDVFFESGTIEPQPETAAGRRSPPPEMLADSTLVSLPPIPDSALAEAFARVVSARATRLAEAQRAGAQRTRKRRGRSKKRQ